VSLPWENPVARHGIRLSTWAGWPRRILATLGLLVVALAAGVALQAFWQEMEVYTALRPEMATRVLGMTLLAEALLALPWAAARGALLWRRLERDGSLEEYRRSRLSPVSLVGGVGVAALTPVAWLLLASLGLSAVGVAKGGLAPVGVLWAHGLLAAQCMAFAALGIALVGRLRLPGLALPLALVLLATCTGAIAAIDPFLRGLGDPSPWIYWALLPNPVTAVGNALETDVLRFSWLYARLHAHEYFFVYPPAWQTCVFYCVGAALFGGAAIRRVSRTG
jgi:hypothetical protein